MHYMPYLVPSCELVTRDNTRVVLEPGWGKPTKNVAIIWTRPSDHIWGQSHMYRASVYGIQSGDCVTVRGVTTWTDIPPCSSDGNKSPSSWSPYIRDEIKSLDIEMRCYQPLILLERYNNSSNIL